MSDNEKAPTIIHLPELVIWLITEKLNYEDLQNLRVTCKKLKLILDQRPFRCLHLFVHEYPFEFDLQHTGELVSHANTFRVTGLSFFKSIKFRNKFGEQLKLLTIHYPWLDKSGIDLSDLNCFEQLVHLELFGLVLVGEKLSLRNLKIAFFENADMDQIVNFEMDCPRLEALVFGTNVRPRLYQETCNSIRHLYVTTGDQTIESFLGYLLPKLSNLCSITFAAGGHLELFLPKVIEGSVCSPSLKIIQIKQAGGSGDYKFVLRNFIRLKSSPKTQHIEVQINSKAVTLGELTKMLELSQKGLRLFYDDYPDELFRHCTTNTVLHCLLPSIRQLNLRSDESVRLSKPLIGKLIYLDYLIFGAETKIDAQFFKCILKTCRGIRFLDIGVAVFKQHQLNRMPDYFLRLAFLNLRECYDLRFVVKFKNLTLLKLHLKDFGNFYHDQKRFIFEGFKNQRNFSFEINGSKLSPHCYS